MQPESASGDCQPNALHQSLLPLISQVQEFANCGFQRSPRMAHSLGLGCTQLSEFSRAITSDDLLSKSVPAEACRVICVLHGPS